MTNILLCTHTLHSVYICTKTMFLPPLSLEKSPLPPELQGPGGGVQGGGVQFWQYFSLPIAALQAPPKLDL